MVYSSELGYDPDEWEECPETEHFLALSLFTRICLGILTAFVAMLFFWILELNKRKGHKLEEQKTKVEPWRPLEDIGRDEEELSAETRLERASQEAEQKARPERRRNSKRELTKDDEMALLAWKAEVHRVEQERLRASEELIDSEIDESQQNPEFTFEDGNIENKELEKQKEKKVAKEFTDIAPGINIPEENDEKNKKDANAQRQIQKIGEEEEKEKFEPDPIAFTSIFAKSSEEIQKIAYDDDLLPANAPGTSEQIQEQLNKTQEMGDFPLLLELPRPKDLTRLHAEFAPGATPPCTPPGGIPAEKVPEVAAHYRQMADELTRKLLEELDEMGGAEADAREMAAEFKNRHKGQIEGALEGSGASQEVCKEMERQLETHMETVVSQEMRRRSSAAILAKEADENKKALEEHESKKGAGAKKGSSSSEEGFVKIRATATDEDELGVPSGDLFVAASPSSPPILLVENRLTPSPQMATTDDEEMEQAGGIRVSLFSAGEGDGDGMSTTADDIEFVQSAGPSPMPPPIEKINEQKVAEGALTTKVVVKRDRRELNADETEQVLALLQEYDLGESGGNAADEERRRQFSSGAASSKVSSGGIISLPESAQPTPGSNSIPETPGSLGFDFINFPAGNGGGQQEVAIDKTSNESPKTMGMRRIEMVEQQLKAGDEWEEDAGTLNRPKLPPELPFPPTNEEAATLLQREEMNAEVNKITRIEQREKVEAQFQLPSSGSSSQKEKDSKQQKAEKFLQEALDYMEQANTKGQKGGQELGEQQTAMGAGEFVVEEEMLESEEGGAPGQKATKLTPVAGRKEKSSKKGGSTTGGADGTSKQIRTNEVFDKPDPMFLFDDADDRDVTYAPEIQSMEVPPDQLSQADSLNLVDENFSEHQEMPSASAEGKISSRKTAEKEEIEQQKEVVVHEKRVVKEWKMETKGGDEGERAKHYGVDDFEEEGGNGGHHGRELTPREEAELQREIDQLRRTPSPRYPDQPPKPKKPQAPQFLRSYFNNDESTSSGLDSTSMRQSSLLSAVGVSSTQEMLLKLTSLEALSEAMRKAGLESSNLIFGIDYTASNKYQGERSFGGRSLHSIADPNVENPYQQVIKIMGRTLAPFAGTEYGIPVFGFGDSSTGDWSVFAVNGTREGECSDLEDVLRVYNRVTPSIDLSGPTNFAPLIYRSMEICHRRKDYHILVIIADGQVTNERATRKAIVSACQYPLSIIVVGVGDGPWDMMRVFDESLPKRPWDNFHFVEFHALITEKREELTMHQNPELAFAVHSLLEIPDQYNIIRKIGMLLPTYYTRPQPHSPRSNSPKPQFKK